MNWKLDTNNPYVWQVEGAPFGVEKIDTAYYVPFRLWGKSRVYVGSYSERGRTDLFFTNRREAFAYVEKAVKEYLESAIVGITAS